MSQYRRPRMRFAPVGLVLALTLGLVTPSPAQVPTAPSVRLVRASSDVTLHKYRRSVPLDLGVYVGAVGGDFVLRAARPDFGQPIELAQLDPTTGEVVRDLPEEFLHDFSGLRDFSTVTFRGPGGKLVARKSLRFCPNSYDRQRLNDSGPVTSRFPEGCMRGFPFLRGMIWGIDEGWATSLRGDSYRGQTINVPAGEYTVRVRIAPAFAAAFEVPPEDALVTLKVTVVDDGGDGRLVDPHSASSSSAMPGPEEGVPVVTNPDPSTLPDLAALPAFAINLERTATGRERLTFAANEWNAGPRPVVVEGFRRADEDIMDAFQYFYDADGNAVGKAPVGTLEFHSGRGHNHWHFLQFVRYTLRSIADDEIVRSKKQSFCIVPTDAVDLSLPGANLRPYSLGLHSACGGPDSIWVREALDVGWGDTYYQYAAGQAFNISDLPNGQYQIRIHVNPDGDLYDVDSSNDAETRLIEISGDPGERTVTVAPWNGIDA